MGIEQGFDANKEVEVAGKNESSPEKEYSQEELVKIGEKVIARISEVKKSIEDLKNGKDEKWNEAIKTCPPHWTKETIEKVKQEDIKDRENEVKELESFIE